MGTRQAELLIYVQGCRAAKMDGSACGRPVNKPHIHCHQHGATPTILPPEAVANWGLDDRHDHYIVLDDGPAHRHREPVAVAAPPPPPAVVYHSTQTVHARSVNQSFLDGADVLLRTPPVDESYAIGLLAPLWKISLWGVRGHIQQLCANRNRIAHLQFKELFCAAMAVVREHPQRQLLLDRLREELGEGIGYCLQGNMARLVNAFSGIVDGVRVGVSAREQLQAAMAAIAAGGGATGEKAAKARATLRELEVPEAEWAAWLDAFEDDSPAPATEKEGTAVAVAAPSAPPVLEDGDPVELT